MEDNMQKFFNVLKQIEPRAEYLESSKTRILRSAQDPVQPKAARFSFSLFEGLHLTGAAALGALVLIIVGTAAYVSLPSRLASAPSITNDSLAREAEQADFQLKIAEVNYYDESAEQVAMALDEIAENGSQQ